MTLDSPAQCDCGNWSRWVEKGTLPLWFDRRINEWQLTFVSRGGVVSIPFYYCFHCGKPMPPSHRANFFSEPEAAELGEVQALMGGVTSLAELEARLGSPDHEFTADDLEPDPDVQPLRRQWTYSRRWKSLELIAQEDPEGRVSFITVGHYLAGRHLV